MIDSTTAVARCCERIRKRAHDPRLTLVSGLADDLRLIGEAFAHIERQQRLLARFAITYRTSALDEDDAKAVFELSRSPLENPT